MARIILYARTVVTTQSFRLFFTILTNRRSADHHSKPLALRRRCFLRGVYDHSKSLALALRRRCFLCCNHTPSFYSLEYIQYIRTTMELMILAYLCRPLLLIVFYRTVIIYGSCLSIFDRSAMRQLLYAFYVKLKWIVTGSASARPPRIYFVRFPGTSDLVLDSIQ